MQVVRWFKMLIHTKWCAVNVNLSWARLPSRYTVRVYVVNERKKARKKEWKTEKENGNKWANERIKLNYAWALCMPNFSLSKSGSGNDDDDDDDVDENNNSLRNLYTHYMRDCVRISYEALNVIHSSCLGYIRVWIAVTATIATAKIMKKNEWTN